MAESKVILGIDPGSQIMGYGLIEVSGTKTMRLIAFGSIKFNKTESHTARLKKIYERVNFLLEEYTPDEAAIESPFFGKNVQAMLNLGRAQGVAMAAVLNYGLEIVEYAPRKVKQAVTGNGNATKEKVLQMLGALLENVELPEHFDASDALAVAVCHFFNQKSISSAKSGNTWASFIEKNPDRVK